MEETVMITAWSSQSAASPAGPSGIRRRIGAALGTITLASAMTLAVAVSPGHAAPPAAGASAMPVLAVSIGRGFAPSNPSPTQPTGGTFSTSETGCCA
jgi:hypothetical protein